MQERIELLSGPGAKEAEKGHARLGAIGARGATTDFAAVMTRGISLYRSSICIILGIVLQRRSFPVSLEIRRSKVKALKRFATWVVSHLFGEAESGFLPSHHLSHYGPRHEDHPSDTPFGLTRGVHQEDYLAGYPR